MSARSSDCSDDGTDDGGVEVNFEGDSGEEEQVSADTGIQVSADTGTQVPANVGKQVPSEQVASERSSPNSHIRFGGSAGKESASPDNNTAASSDTSSKGGGPSSPLTLRRRKKKPIPSSAPRQGPSQEQKEIADKRARAHESFRSNMQQIEDHDRIARLTDGLKNPFRGSSAPSAGNSLAIGSGDMANHVPLTGPYVTEEEAANLLAAQEVQRACNAAGEKEKMVLRKTRSGKTLPRPSLAKPKP